MDLHKKHLEGLQLRLAQEIAKSGVDESLAISRALEINHVPTLYKMLGMKDPGHRAGTIVKNVWTGTRGVMNKAASVKGFWSGFEKRAFLIILPAPTQYSQAVPLRSEAAKKKYTEDETRTGRHAGYVGGGLAGGLAGAAIGTGARNPVVGAIGGGVLGALAGGTGLGALGHHLSARTGKRHADAGVGVVRGHDLPDVISRAQGYHKLNSESDK